MVRKTRSHARKQDQVLRPLFPRYLFVRPASAQCRWRSINGTVGVSYVLANDEAVIEVPDYVVAEVERRMDEDGVVQVEDKGLSPGQPVRVVQGPFSDAEGLFSSVDSGARVTVLLSLLGGEVRMSVPRNYVQAAS